MTSKFNVNMKLSEFNNLSLKDQETVSEMLYNTSSNQFFTKISELLLYLIQIIDGNECNLAEISSPGQTKLTYLQSESTVILHSSTVERLAQNRCFERSEFKDVLKKFYSITAELVYPSDSFKDTYNMIPSSFVSSLKLSDICSDNSSHASNLAHLWRRLQVPITTDHSRNVLSLKKLFLRKIAK